MTIAMSDPLETLKTTWGCATRGDALIPLLVDGLLVTVGGVVSLGILLPPLMLGYADMTLSVARGERVAMGDSLSGLKRFGSAWVLGLACIGLLILGGLALGVGAAVASFLLTYALWVSADAPALGVVDVLKRAFALAWAAWPDTLVLWGVNLVLGTLLSATVVGSVVAFAFGFVMSAVLYLRHRHTLAASY